MVEEYERGSRIFWLFLKWYILLPFILFPFGWYFWLRDHPQLLRIHTIRKDQLIQMSAEEYIGLMRQTSYLVIPQDVTFWPKPKDIPYLLTLTESQEYAGSTVHSDWASSAGYESTVGVTAVFLLRAIVDGRFRPYSGDQYPPDKEGIIARAKEVMRTGKLVLDPLAGRPTLDEYALAQLSARDVIEMLKKTDLLVICPAKTNIDKLEGWPKQEDISSLIFLIDSRERSGIFYSCYSNHFPHNTDSTVGEAVRVLLYATKAGSFDLFYFPKLDIKKRYFLRDEDFMYFPDDPPPKKAE